jgi:lauroyl/myristoyl acyltransferase
LSFFIAGWLGGLGYYVLPLRRQIARENFAQVLGKSRDDPEVRRLAHNSFRNFGRYLRDVMLYPSLSIEELSQRVTLRSPNHFADALAVGKGLIIVSAHFGNMDMAGSVIAQQFAPVTLVGETLNPQQLMDFLTRARAARNVNLFPYDSAPRKIVQALKRNEATAFLLDFGITHHFDLTTVPVTFFGMRTNFPAGPAQLALLTGAPIVVGHAVVASNEHIDVYTNPPIFATRADDRREGMRLTMQQIATKMEEFIRQQPDQWYMFRPMWREQEDSVRRIQRLTKNTHKNSNE